MQKSYSFLVILFLFVAPAITATIPISQTSFSDSVSPAESAFFIRGPTVNLVTNDSATIFWRTDSSTNSTVSYGLNASMLESESSASLVTDHLIELTGLEMDQKYYYQAESDGTTSEVYYFHTSPADGADFKLIIAGDNRPSSSDAPTQPEQLSQIADMIIAEEPHLVILTGDFVHSIGTVDSDNLHAWELFNAIADEIGHYAPIIGVIGNHDTGASTGSVKSQYYLDAFINVGTDTTYFSFDYAGAHFTILDSEEYDYPGRIAGTQYDWLVDDLSTSNASNKFVIAHRPLYPVNHIGSALDVNIEERDQLQELFEDQNVTLFASGHDHCYARLIVNDVVHIITGGLGAPLYITSWSRAEYHYVTIDVSDAAIDLDEVTIDDVIGDTWSLPYDGPILIQLRFMVEILEYPEGTLPEVYFSSHPETTYYSWDSESNSSTLEGLPGAPGEHSLDIYAEDESGIWSHESYTFTTRDDSDTTTDPAFVDPVLIIIIGIGAALAVVVVVIILKRK
ncbi:MAG: metallophosphoesterase [Candidatus Thorarchaeota archaeon]